MADTNLLASHSAQPVQPLEVEGIGTFCGCDDCVRIREEITASKPPLLAELNTLDAEDKLDWHDKHGHFDIGGEG
jgi:hypothetical protein